MEQLVIYTIGTELVNFTITKVGYQDDFEAEFWWFCERAFSWIRNINHLNRLGTFWSQLWPSELLTQFPKFGFKSWLAYFTRNRNKVAIPNHSLQFFWEAPKKAGIAIFHEGFTWFKKTQICLKEYLVMTAH